MKITRQVIVFDAADLAPESAFWAGLLGGIVVEDDDWHSVLVDGEWRLGVQLAPNHVPPKWPEGTQQQQIHLDLHVDDLQAAHQKALSLGARLLQAAGDLEAAEGYQVYADPAGHPFCLGWGHPSDDRIRDIYRSIAADTREEALTVSDESRPVIERFWQTMNANDFPAVGRLLHDDFLLEWPQSGERIRGRENYVTMNQLYPAAGRWRFTVRRLLTDGSRGVSDVTVTDGERIDQAVTFFELREGRIWRMTEYWPDPFARAEWRRALVE